MLTFLNKYFSREKNEENRNFDDFDSRDDFHRFRSGDETTSTGSVRTQTHSQSQMFSGQERRRLPRLHPPLPQGQLSRAEAGARKRTRLRKGSRLRQRLPRSSQLLIFQNQIFL